MMPIFYEPDSLSLSDEETLERKVDAIDSLNEANEILNPEFTIRSNISFSAEKVSIENFPLPNHILSFEVNNYMQIRSKFNDDWWIGNVIKSNSVIGFIPSPNLLESLGNGRSTSLEDNQELTTINSLGELKNSSSPSNLQNYNSLLRKEEKNKDSYSPQIAKQNKTVFLTSSIMKRFNTETMSPKSPRSLNTPNNSNSMKSKVKRFLKKENLIIPYEIVPSMRPIFLVGPSLKGFPVTDKMQMTILKLLRKRFEDRITILKVLSDLTKIPNKASTNHEKKNNFVENKKSPISDSMGIEQDINKIFEISSQMKLLIIDCDFISHPNQIAKSCLAPIIICITVEHVEVLTRLIKNQGKSKRKKSSDARKSKGLPLFAEDDGAISWLKMKDNFIKAFHSVVLCEPDEEEVKPQITAAVSLLECCRETCDLVLNQNNVDMAFKYLVNFLENQWNLTHSVKPKHLLINKTFDKIDGSVQSANYLQQIGINGEFLRSEISNLLSPTLGWTGLVCLNASPILIKQIDIKRARYRESKEQFTSTCSSKSSSSKTKSKYIPIWKKPNNPMRYLKKNSLANIYAVDKGSVCSNRSIHKDNIPKVSIWNSSALEQQTLISKDFNTVYSSRSNIQKRQILAKMREKQVKEEQMKEIMSRRRLRNNKDNIINTLNEIEL